ncbi:hypothetical protein E4U60_006593 [Claviceps pazoutovae]|uniref:Uncharacterized protein n=1 Tax=Claviceps pazoutovae TaxID=1649127 RepID=A0A9P7MGF0_9HYPO|nr:hypothetical protein E4U60_006593 [Claviceps pazoutovae]
MASSSLHYSPSRVYSLLPHPSDNKNGMITPAATLRVAPSRWSMILRADAVQVGATNCFAIYNEYTLDNSIPRTLDLHSTQNIWQSLKSLSSVSVLAIPETTTGPFVPSWNVAIEPGQEDKIVVNGTIQQVDAYMEAH